MSKIWVNGQEIDLAKLTSEQLSALTENCSYEIDETDYMYLSDTLSGDCSCDNPLGVVKLPHSIIVSVNGEEGEVVKQKFDGTQDVEVSLNNYKDVVDHNTIVGNGTEQSPLMVSEDLLSAIDSAYTTSIQTAFVLDGMQRQVEEIEDYHNEISAKCDFAINQSSIATIIAESAMSIALSASCDVDKLYDFISTLIYDIVYDNTSHSLIVTYVDGTKSTIEMTDLESVSANVEHLNEVVLTLCQFIKGVEYNSENSSIVVTYSDGSEKVVVINDIAYVKSEISTLKETIEELASSVKALRDEVDELKK